MVEPDSGGEGQEFRFRSGNAAIKGGIGGGSLVAGGLLWATLTGRIHEPNIAYFGTWALACGVVGLALWRGHRKSVEHARALGCVRLSAEHLRWVRADESVIVDLPWSRVVEAVVDTRTSTIVVVSKPDGEDGPRSSAVIGDASGYVALENFGGLLVSFGHYCSLQAPDGNDGRGRGLAKKAWATSAAFALVTLALLWANRRIEVAYAPPHPFAPVPYGTGGLALLYALAGVAFGRGRVPLVSQLHVPAFWTRRIPLAMVALVAANFMLGWLLRL